MSKKPELNEALDIYYRLKNEYYEKIKEHKNSVRKDNTLTLKEKRAKFANIKHKCINCSNLSGTIFTNVYSPETNERHLIAKCGDTRNPCELLIDIALGECDSLGSYIKQAEDIIETNKQRVIRDKNNMLFGYITSDEALKLFDKYKKDITDYTQLLEMHLNDYNNATLNKTKLSEIKKIQQEIYANIDEIKKQMANFADRNNTQAIKNAVNIYIDNLLPLNKSLIETKYNACFVDIKYDPFNKPYEYRLIQKENTINSLEFCLDSNVISFQLSSYSNEPSQKKKKTKEEKEREKEEKEENEEKALEKEEKKRAKEEKEREKEEKKRAKEEKALEKEEKKKAKEEKEREKEEKKKAKEEKKKNKQTGGYDGSSSEDESDSSASSSSSSSSDDESESSSSENEE